MKASIMINTRAYLRRATFYVQNMQGGKNEAKKNMLMPVLQDTMALWP